MKCDALMALAHEHSPRVEMHGAGLVLLDVDGLGQLWGTPRQVGERLRRAAAERQLGVRVAIAGTKMAALLATQGRCGLTVIQPGDEAKRVSTFPLSVLTPLSSALAESVLMLLPIVQRWGIKTLGALADLPTDELCTRLGPSGVELQRIARGQDSRPLVPEAEDERFEQTVALAIEGLEPLAFVLGRVLDPLCGQLDARGVAVGMLHVRLTLVTRETHAKTRTLGLCARSCARSVVWATRCARCRCRDAPCAVDAGDARDARARAPVSCRGQRFCGRSCCSIWSHILLRPGSTRSRSARTRCRPARCSFLFSSGPCHLPSVSRRSWPD